MINKGKQNRSRYTIQTILAASAQVLIERGYDKSTTNRIAKHAGYSVGTVYQYFQDKEDIFGELIDQALAETLHAVSECPVQDTLKATLQQLVSRILHGLEQNPALVQALGVLLIGKFRDKRAGTYESIIISITRLLECHRNEITVGDLELAARIIVGAAEGLTNSGDMELMNCQELETHLLRLQFAYLTMKQTSS